MGSLNLSNITTFVALGDTFAGHGEFLSKWPHLWTVPSQCVVPEGHPIEIPEYCEEVILNPEPAIVIGDSLWQASEAEAADAIEAFTVSNDVLITGKFPAYPYEDDPANPMVEHEIQEGMGRKVMPTAQPTLTETIECPYQDLEDLAVEASIDGETVISGSTSDLRYMYPEMVAHASKLVRLQPGDVISIGSPGIDRPKPIIDDAESVTCTVESVGELTNPVELI